MASACVLLCLSQSEREREMRMRTFAVSYFLKTNGEATNTHQPSRGDRTHTVVNVRVDAGNAKIFAKYVNFIVIIPFCRSDVLVGDGVRRRQRRCHDYVYVCMYNRYDTLGLIEMLDGLSGGVLFPLSKSRRLVGQKATANASRSKFKDKLVLRHLRRVEVSSEYTILFIYPSLRMALCPCTLSIYSIYIYTHTIYSISTRDCARRASPSKRIEQRACVLCIRVSEYRNRQNNKKQRCEYVVVVVVVCGAVDMVVVVY